MPEETNQAPNLYALLIGIDCYMPNILPDGSRYKNLGGCVRDINHVEAFLKEMRKVPQNQILKLTASIASGSSGNEKPLESPENLPTRENMIASFRKLGEMAPEGSQVYIHYSGHGGRAKTVFPKFKGENGIDEGLVPTDIGTSEGQYLRDLDLAQLFRELAAKKLTVTAVLDCCHSGGATRGDAEVRGMDVLDDKPLKPGQELVALETLDEISRSLAKGTRGLQAGGLPNSQDYVVLAACRPNELAYEYAFNRETGERNGALTYWMLDTLRQQNPGQTYKDLYDRLNAKIRSQFSQQTPMLLGQANLTIFGNELVKTQYAAGVIQVDEENKKVLLQAGQSVGLRKEAVFTIYPRGTQNFGELDKRKAVAKIVELGATESWCSLEPIENREPVEQGDQAILISASTNLVRKVGLFKQREATAEEMAQARMVDELPANTLPPEVFSIQDEVLKAIANAIPGNGWIDLVELDPNKKTREADDAGVHYIVALNVYGEYEICDRTGAPLKNIRPAVKPGDSNAAATIVQRLVHIAKYQATQELDNFDRNSPLAGKLKVEWLGKLESDAYDPVDPPPEKSGMRQFDDTNNPTIKVGDWIFLSIQNNSQTALNIAVLDLEADWAIEQVHPSDAPFITVAAGGREVIPFKLSLPNDYEEGIDIAKVFATAGSPNFRWLELPSLDRSIPKAATRSLKPPEDPLDQLLSCVATDTDAVPPTRTLNPAKYPSREWTTKQVRVTVKKN